MATYLVCSNDDMDDQRYDQEVRFLKRERQITLRELRETQEIIPLFKEQHAELVQSVNRLLKLHLPEKPGRARKIRVGDSFIRIIANASSTKFVLYTAIKEPS